MDGSQAEPIVRWRFHRSRAPSPAKVDRWHQNWANDPAASQPGAQPTAGRMRASTDYTAARLCAAPHRPPQPASLLTAWAEAPLPAAAPLVPRSDVPHKVPALIAPPAIDPAATHPTPAAIRSDADVLLSLSCPPASQDLPRYGLTASQAKENRQGEQEHRPAAKENSIIALQPTQPGSSTRPSHSALPAAAPLPSTAPFISSTTAKASSKQRQALLVGGGGGFVAPPPEPSTWHRLEGTQALAAGLQPSKRRRAASGGSSGCGESSGPLAPTSATRRGQQAVHRGQLNAEGILPPPQQKKKQKKQQQKQQHQQQAERPVQQQNEVVSVVKAGGVAAPAVPAVPDPSSLCLDMQAAGAVDASTAAGGAAFECDMSRAVSCCAGVLMAATAGCADATAWELFSTLEPLSKQQLQRLKVAAAGGPQRRPRRKRAAPEASADVAPDLAAPAVDIQPQEEHAVALAVLPIFVDAAGEGEGEGSGIGTPGRSLYLLPLAPGRWGEWAVDGGAAARGRALTEQLLGGGGGATTVCFNAQATLRILRLAGVRLPPPHRTSLVDPGLLAWLLEPQLMQKAEKELEGGYFCLEEQAARYLPCGGAALHQTSTALASRRAGKDSGTGADSTQASSGALVNLRTRLDVAIRLGEGLHRRLLPHLPPEAVAVEMQVAAGLAEMEAAGLGFDPWLLLHHHGAALRAALADVERRATALAGRAFNLSSPVQIAEVLYVVLGLPPPGAAGRAAAKGHLPTDEAALRSLSHLSHLPGLILEHRALRNFASKWVDAGWVAAAAGGARCLQDHVAAAAAGGGGGGDVSGGDRGGGGGGVSGAANAATAGGLSGGTSHPAAAVAAAAAGGGGGGGGTELLLPEGDGRWDWPRVRCSWNQTATATGRLSSSGPNLQAVTKYHLATGSGSTQWGHHPSADNLTTATVNTHASTSAHPASTTAPGSNDAALAEPSHAVPAVLNARDAFLARRGCVLLSADYSQVELRILAHLSGDAALIEVLRRTGAGGDAFRQLAATWLRTATSPSGAASHSSVPPPHPSRQARSDHPTRAAADAAAAAVTPCERGRVKQIVYGLLYGLSAYGLSQTTANAPAGQALSVPAAQALIDSFLQRFPGVAAYLTSVKAAARREGGVRTLAGRVRPIKGLASHDKRLLAEADRKAVNSTVQGSAADVIKRAMVGWWGWAEGAGWPPVRLVAQIHDELIFEVDVRRMDLHAAAAAVRAVMCGVVQLQAPLTVNIKVGERWGSMTPLELP